MMEMTPGVGEMDVVADLSQGAQVNAGLNFKDAEKAKELEGMVTMYKSLFGASNPKLATILNKLEVKVQDKRADLKLSLNEEELKGLL